MDDVHAKAKRKRQNAPQWKLQLTQELLKPKRNRFKRRSVYSSGVDSIWTADLMDVHRYARQNKGYKYILVCLDVFSRYAWARPLKTKTGIEVAEALKDIFKGGRTPDKLWTDRGTEFWNKNVKYELHGQAFNNASVQRLLHKNKIELYSTHNEPKATIAERFIRTLRNKIESNYILTQSTVWYDILPHLIEEYNKTYHHTIKMTPEQACEPEKFQQLHQQLQEQHAATNLGQEKFKAGDRVRISIQKKTFDKGATPNWTEEIFEVTEILPTRPITYKIKDLEGEEVKGGFYNEQLQKTNQQIYRVDKVLRRRKVRGRADEVLVSWCGYPDKFNQWLPAADVHHSQNHD